MEITHDDLEKLAKFLHKEIGIFLDTHKLPRLRYRIEELLQKHQLKDFHTFYHQLRFVRSQELLQDLINVVTVNETYFWREEKQFSILVNEVLPRFIDNSHLNSVRILVAPCSSGEELYSIMLAILDAATLIDHLNIEIMGIDIDSNMIYKAQQGIYTQRSIEKLPKYLLQTYFTKVAQGYKISDELIHGATFLQQNIFEPNIEHKLGRFDIIFSRNMLIYFNSVDKQRCYKTFHKLLQPKGYLFLGHADAHKIDKELFMPLKQSFHIFQKE